MISFTQLPGGNFLVCWVGVCWFQKNHPQSTTYFALLRAELGFERLGGDSLCPCRGAMLLVARFPCRGLKDNTQPTYPHNIET